MAAQAKTKVMAFAVALAICVATTLTLRAQDPAAQCPDGSTRLSGSWCVGDLLAGIGGPVTYDGNGLPIPTWDVAGRPVQRLDAADQPIPQRAGQDGSLSAASSPRFISRRVTE